MSQKNKIYIYTLLFPLLLHASSLYQNSCSYCHSNKIKLAKSQLKQEWYQLTQEHNTTLKEIHKKNLSVLAYLNSPAYKPKKLYAEMKFSAPIKRFEKRVNEKSQRRDPYRDSCRHCHYSKVKLAKYYSKEQWFSVVRDGTLAKVHTKNLDFLVYLNSTAYSPSKLYSSIQNLAPEEARHSSKHSELTCLNCHGSRINLSHLWLDSEWERLHDTLEPLRVKHSRNLDALELIESQEFHENIATFIKDMKFFAYNKRLSAVKRTQQKGYSCLYCHDNHSKLAKLWSVKKWERLKETLEPLAEVHPNELAVLDELKSSRFQQTLPKLIIKMQSLAPDLQKHKITEGKITFSYEKDRATKEEAQILFEELKHSLDGCQFSKPISFSLQIDTVDTSTANTLISLMTIFVIPNRTTTTWSMRAKYDGQEFISYAKLAKDVGLLSIGSKEMSLRDSIKQLSDDLMRRMNIECKR